MQDGVLNSANVLVDPAVTKPVLRYLSVEGRTVVVRIGVAIEVLGRIDESIHGVGFTPRRAATPGTHGVHKLRHSPER
jgi:hypothetical protein